MTRLRLVVALATLAALAIVPSAFAGPGLPFSGTDVLGLSATVGNNDTGTVTITNSDATAHTIDSVDTTGDPAFTAGGGCNNAALQPGDTCTVGITFTPGSAGVKSGALDVNYDSTTTQANVAILGGTATNPVIAPPTFSPSSHDFGIGTVGVAASQQQFTLTNPNAVGLTVNSITSEAGAGLNPGAFKKPGDSCSGSVVAAHGTCTFTIQYYPSAAQNQTGLINVDTSSASPSTISVTGIGKRPPPFTGLLGSSGCTGTTLTWHVPAGVFGSWIVRNASHMPTSPSDGTRRLRTSQGVLIDGHLKQFHTYYYAIYAQYKTLKPAGNGIVIYSNPKTIALRTGRICKPQNHGHITSTTPLIDWTALSGSFAYGLRIYNHGKQIFTWAAVTTQSQHKIPASFVYQGRRLSLHKGQTYSVFLYAYTQAHKSGYLVASSKFTIKP